MGLGAYLLMNDKNVAGFCFLIGSALPSIVIFFANKSKKNYNLTAFLISFTILFLTSLARADLALASPPLFI